MRATGKFQGVHACRPLLAGASFVAACLFSGCETTTQTTPVSSQGTAFIERSYQIPVGVPGLHGRYDRTRGAVRQQVIVRPGEPATFRMEVDVRRPARDSELRVFSGGSQLFAIPAVAMRPGDPAISVVVALPVDQKRQVLDVLIELHPAASDAAFDVGAATVTIGEVAPELLKVE